MTKKGFTLVELLATIAILAILIIIAVPAVLKISENAKENMYCNKIKMLEQAAILYAQDNELPVGSITVQDLINSNYIDYDKKTNTLLDPRNDSSMNSISIDITLVNYNYSANIMGVCGNPGIPTYTLTINTLGGGITGATSIALTEGENLTINTPMKFGHTFNNWTVTGEGSSLNGTTFTMGSANATLTAEWTMSGTGLTNVDGKLIYKGTDPSNYLKFAGDTDVYRIISFETDGTIKIVNMTHAHNIPYDISGSRNKTTSPYCVASQDEAETGVFKGCNAWSMGTSWLGLTDGTDNVGRDSSILEYLRDTYYVTLPVNIKNKILEHDFNVGLVGQNIDVATINTQAAARKWRGKIGLIGVDDAVNASATGCTSLGVSNTSCSNYFTKATSSTIGMWTMNGASINTWDVWNVFNGSSIGKKRASRYKQDPIVFYAHPAFYINSNYLFTGNGSSSTPFIID